MPAFRKSDAAELLDNKAEKPEKQDENATKKKKKRQTRLPFFRLSPDDYAGLHKRAGYIYGNMTLAADERASGGVEQFIDKLQTAFRSLMAWLHKRGKFNAEMLSEKEPADFIEQMTDVFNQAVDKSIKQVPLDEISRRRLQESNYIFSGIKTFHELNEAFPSLFDDEGVLKPFERFLKDVQKINDTYNAHYLRTEYDFAVNSSLMAAKWKEFEQDGDRYNLQYRTVGDERVRASHRALEGITLPITSQFWDSYMPPNGYGCRCDVVQVRKDKYPLSNEREALNLASQATAGKHQEMMRFNPGKEMTTFPAYNAYTRSKCKECKNNTSGSVKLAAKIPDNELCKACEIVRRQMSGATAHAKRYDKNEWDKTYISDNDTGFVVTQKQRIKEAEQSKRVRITLSLAIPPITIS